MCRKCVFWRCRSTGWSWSWGRSRSRSRSCYWRCSCSVFGFRFGLTVTVTVFWLCRVLCVAPLIVQLHKYLNCVPPRDFFVLLAGLYFDSYRFAAPHDAATLRRRRCRWRFILPGSCNSFPKICMAGWDGMGWDAMGRDGSQAGHHYIGNALSSLPAYALALALALASAACHIQHICNMYELCGISLSSSHSFPSFQPVKNFAKSCALCFVHV